MQYTNNTRKECKIFVDFFYPCYLLREKNCFNPFESRITRISIQKNKQIAVP